MDRNFTYIAPAQCSRSGISSVCSFVCVATWRLFNMKGPPDTSIGGCAGSSSSTSYYDRLPCGKQWWRHGVPRKTANKSRWTRGFQPSTSSSPPPLFRSFIPSSADPNSVSGSVPDTGRRRARVDWSQNASGQGKDEGWTTQRTD